MSAIDEAIAVLRKIPKTPGEEEALSALVGEVESLRAARQVVLELHDLLVEGRLEHVAADACARGEINAIATCTRSACADLLAEVAEAHGASCT